MATPAHTDEPTPAVDISTADVDAMLLAHAMPDDLRHRVLAAIANLHAKAATQIDLLQRELVHERFVAEQRAELLESLMRGRPSSTGQP